MLYLHLPSVVFVSFWFFEFWKKKKKKSERECSTTIENHMTV